MIDAGKAAHRDDVAGGRRSRADDADVDDAGRVFEQDAGLVAHCASDHLVDASRHGEAPLGAGLAVELEIRDFVRGAENRSAEAEAGETEDE